MNEYDLDDDAVDRASAPASVCFPYLTLLPLDGIRKPNGDWGEDRGDVNRI